VRPLREVQARRLHVLEGRSLVPKSARTAELAALLKALADPTRLAMTAMLHREPGALCVCHIEAQFALSQPTISHHLRVLRESGLVTSEKRGAWVYYALDRVRLSPAVDALLASVELEEKERCACP
jgi:ArsR family transcriptional regulator, arsenate/arsenite/antimonite-responsive transcriptional repressor